MWFVFALLSAVFAALTSILAKIGIEGEFESRDGDSDDGGSRDGMGNGFSDACAEWDWIDQSKELAVSDSVRTCDRCVVALLLSCASDRRGVKGGADR